MKPAGILRRAMLAVAATGAALACLSVASATVAVVPAAIVREAVLTHRGLLA